ncbi:MULTISPECIES: class III lanthipeptide [Bacillus]|nr:class III lanthipeptide [Bacillus mycoides]MBE7129908.1 SapB/AmfS family lantipeptide [Bacillus mycoides]
MSRFDVLSLQSLKKHKNNDKPVGSNISVNCKTQSGLSLFFCVSPK